jgi:hypothetical protein
MSNASESTIQVLTQEVRGRVGTNLALVHLLWAIITGSFLSSRGAIFGALSRCGFTVQQIRRSWQALHRGTWSIGRLVENWQEYVASPWEWQANRYIGYRPLSVGTTTFWPGTLRVRLAAWVGKFYQPPR